MSDLHRLVDHDRRRGARRTPRPARPTRRGTTTSAGSPRTTLPSGTPLEGAARKSAQSATSSASSAATQIVGAAERHALDLERRARGRADATHCSPAGTTHPTVVPRWVSRRTVGLDRQRRARRRERTTTITSAGPAIGSGASAGRLVTLAEARDVVAQDGGRVRLERGLPALADAPDTGAQLRDRSDAGERRPCRPGRARART